MSIVADQPIVKKIKLDPAVTRRVKMIDKFADYLIRGGGLLVIVVVALIFFFITKEIVPLFLPASSKSQFVKGVPAQTPATAIRETGIDEFEQSAYFLNAQTGSVEIYSLADWSQTGTFPIKALGEAKIVSSYRTPIGDYLFIGTSDGRVLIEQVQFNVTYDEEFKRVVTAKLKEIALVAVPEYKGEIRRIFGRVDNKGLASFGLVTAEGRVYAGNLNIENLEIGSENIEAQAAAGQEEEGIPGMDEGKAKVFPVSAEFEGRPELVVSDRESNRFFVITDAGVLYQWYLEDSTEKPFAVYRDFNNPANKQAQPGRKPVAMEMLIGDLTLLMGFSDGTVEGWLGAREQKTDVLKKVKPVHYFKRLRGGITLIQPSARNKTFLVGSVEGAINLNYSTTAKTLLAYEIPGAVIDLAYAPKQTGVLAVTAEGKVEYRTVHNPHPEISLQSLFGKAWYEGYDEPDYNWQSSSGSDDFEPKYSLVPLTVGTLKGAFYGLLFAIPIAVMAALYTSQFMPYEVRTYVKPAIEIMAALPSVVIGFLAGLWLAPVLEDKLVGLAAVIISLPVAIVLSAIIWNYSPRRWKEIVPTGYEIFLLLPLVITCMLVCFSLGPVFDSLFFGGDFRQWIFTVTGTQFEQRNSIVIGLAMGFAVIPIIFTISEDAFSNVPKNFVSASYALGASKWQTAWRVIAPTASPGVFSAIMIGFGRAVGETMIVLMATGNTPIMSFNPLNGMRTLSANIAVEIPEAPVDGTHYRILFLAALLLFVLTFVVNTVAEIIRQHLREKYKAV
ncbi:MAG: ABC transporter permease subunit [Verrucomicrobiae bacterium]|nr:ABC transporter permease subunit [Verrucomicrobiae bacterium]